MPTGVYPHQLKGRSLVPPEILDSRAASFEDLSQACDRARKRREEVGIIPIIRRKNNALFSLQAIASN